MTTRTVSVRDFRENMTKYLKEGQEKNIHFVVMRHAVPIAKVTPIEQNDSLESLIQEVAQARRDIEEGRTYTTEEVLAMIDRRAHRIHSKGNRKSETFATRHRAKNRTKNAVVRRAGTSSVIRKKTHQ
jgi:antitoxin (DNA-binding transcriptional repressor) of toxin-antitoxin stability system